jgi:hypothetical protein
LDKIICTGFQCFDNGIPAGIDGQDQNIGIVRENLSCVELPDTAAQFETIQSWHKPVSNEDIGAILQNHLECLIAFGR